MRAFDGDDLDFTIGSSWTWLLDESKTYSIQTWLDSEGQSFSSEATLLGQVVGNTANCFVQVEGPNNIPIPWADPFSPWCFGLDETGYHAYYIDTGGFSIRGSGTCYDYTYAQGSVECGFVTAHSVGIKMVGLSTNVWGRVHTSTPVEVWTEVLTSSGFSRSQTRTTDSSGNYVIPLTYGINSPGEYTYRIVVRHSNGEVEYLRNPFLLQRVARPTASSAGSKPVGQASNVWGMVDGGGGSRVWTEVWTGSQWSKSQERRADVTGYYVIPLTYGMNTPGIYRYRVAAELWSGEIVRSNEFQFRRTAG